ncbi:MAG: MerR family transcriptional regulator [Lachnospiraceae bacterium]|jgi:DNA-binding transcriptional MerR regulator/DNA gyrase inhibitor GyrI|nr:MerR family transcriptional regulator [Lachnospiraceae bacterium]
MHLLTISEISKQFNISTRTLRYYEEIGLIQSIKKEDYAYRTYEEETILRLQQILILRKLRIPLKQIALILKNENTAAIIDTFQKNLAEVDEEITALSTIRSIIDTFITRLKENIHQDIKLNLLDDTALLEAMDALTLQRKLNDPKAADLQSAVKQLNRLTDRDVRIIYLPPCTVATAHYIGPDPENNAWNMLKDFVQKAKLAQIYPAARCFGFNHPNPGILENGLYGYEFQVSIPEDLEVPAPLIKKQIKGGLYAAYAILMDEIDGIGWNRLLTGWLKDHPVWKDNMNPSGETMYGLLEEHLNLFGFLPDPEAFGFSSDQSPAGYLQQVDLLLPVQAKK